MAEREVAVQHRERLARMKADKDVFMEKLKAERRTLYMVSHFCMLPHVRHKVRTHAQIYTCSYVSAG